VHNLDANGHPFHLHGFDVYVLEIGASDLNTKGEATGFPLSSEASPAVSALNLINPRKKDTVQIPGNYFVRLRFFADNEGIWAFHCHVLWHQGVGMVMGVQILGDENGVFSNLRAATSSISSTAATGDDKLEDKDQGHKVKVVPATSGGAQEYAPHENINKKRRQRRRSNRR